MQKVLCKCYTMLISQTIQTVFIHQKIDFFPLQIFPSMKTIC